MLDVRSEDVNYEKLYNLRYPLLRKAYERSRISENPGYQQFVRENEWWLKDYALFMALKDRFGGQSWTQWPEDIRLRWGYAMEYYQKELYFDVEFYQYLQFKFFEQYRALKAYANALGIKIIGLSQQRIAQVVELFVIDILTSDIQHRAFRFGKYPLIHQSFQTDEVGISGEGGKGLIGRVAIAGGADGQDLPIGLSCLF